MLPRPPLENMTNIVSVLTEGRGTYEEEVGWEGRYKRVREEGHSGRYGVRVTTGGMG